MQCINGGEPAHIGDVCECFCVGGYTGSSCEGIAALNHNNVNKEFLIFIMFLYL